MKKIQIDMFEVQLGAAMLLQFRDSEGGAVVILADAGVHSSQYDVTHVRDKLPDALDAFESGNRRIDLIVGTHYDADHLRGLVPIIEDEQFEFGEAWMPPVADDSLPIPFDTPLQDSQLLPYIWSRESNEHIGSTINRYLVNKQRQCKTLHRLEVDAIKAFSEVPSPDVSLYQRRIASESEFEAPGELNLKSWRKFFQAHQEDTSRIPGQDFHCGHADDFMEPCGSEFQRLEELIQQAGNSYKPFFTYHDLLSRRSILSGDWNELWLHNPRVAQFHALNLASMRRTISNDAITGTHLAEVVKALKGRSVPIHCQIITDGTPRRFVWKSSTRKFVHGEQLASDGPELKLLGPSQSLVLKHRNRLPFETYLTALSYTSIPIRGITPSNQLSYILKLECEDQSVLVTGDAGCVDFKPSGSREDYYPALLAELQPLHVIQVAHHAGLNAHFYRVLLEANYAAQTIPSYLLLSHATRDHHRPSPEFAQFIGEARSVGDDMQLLFTSVPDAAKVTAFKELIHAVEGGPQADVGDIQLLFDDDWRVAKHAIAV